VFVKLKDKKKINFYFRPNLAGISPQALISHFKIEFSFLLPTAKYYSRFLKNSLGEISNFFKILSILSTSNFVFPVITLKTHFQSNLSDK
jgi:hypothetical protein